MWLLNSVASAPPPRRRHLIYIYVLRSTRTSDAAPRPSVLFYRLRRQSAAHRRCATPARPYLREYLVRRRDATRHQSRPRPYHRAPLDSRPESSGMRRSRPLLRSSYAAFRRAPIFIVAEMRVAGGTAAPHSRRGAARRSIRHSARPTPRRPPSDFLFAFESATVFD